MMCKMAKPMEGQGTVIYWFTDTAPNITWLVICKIIHINGTVCSLQLLTTWPESRINHSETCFKQYWFWCWKFLTGDFYNVTGNFSVDTVSCEGDLVESCMWILWARRWTVPKGKFFYSNTIKVQYRLKSQHQWPNGVSHMSIASRLLGMWVRNPPRGMDVSRL
jgi:hypothetical protein